jgi:hypothetical protein
MSFLPSRKPLQCSLPSRRRSRRPLLERLEDRLAPTVDFMALATGLNQDLATLNTQLATIDSSNALPVVNKPLPQIPSAANLVASFQSTLFNTLKNANNTNAKQNLETNLGALLVGSAGVVFEGPSVDPTGVTITLHLAQPWQNATPDHTQFGLGLPGIPLLITSPNDTAVQVGFDYGTLKFGVHNTSQFFFDAAQADELTVSVDATLPDTANSAITGAIGFLPITATDGPTPTHFHGDFTLNVDNTAHLTNPRLTGQADVQLQMASVATPGVPQVTTTFTLSWPFSQSNPQGSLSTFGSTPTAQFSAIAVDVGTLLGDFAGPQLTKLRDLLKPLQPIFDALHTPLPVIGDGDTPFDLVNSIDPTLGSLVTLADDVNQLAQDVPGVVNALNGVKVNLGTFDLSGNGDLRSLATVDYVNAASNLTTLVATGVGQVFDFQNVENQILGNFADPNSPTALAVKGVLDFFNPNSQPPGIQLTLTFPVFSDPLTGVSDFLLGKADDLIRFDAEVHDQRDFSVTAITLPVLPVGIFADFGGHFNLDGSLVIAYDTFGLLEVVKDMAALKPPPFGDLADGLYMTSSSHLHVDGDVTGTVVVLGPFASGFLNGGVNVHVHLDGVDSADGDGKRRLLQPQDNNVPPGECLFMTSGGITGELSGAVFTTVFVLGFPVTIVIPYDSGLDTLLDLNGGCIGNPLNPPLDLMLANIAGMTATSDPNGMSGEFLVTDPNGVLTLNMGPNAGNRHYEPNNKDELFTVIPDTARVGDPLGAQAVLVSAFGFQQRYAGVKKIFADGGDGSDSIFVAQGITVDAELHGGDGGDKLTYQGDGKCMLIGDDPGQTGDDILMANGQDNTLTGGAGKDQLTGGRGVNHLDGGPDDDLLKAGDGQSFLTGGDGNDKLFAGSGDATLDGGNNNDVLVAGAGTDILLGGLGDDTFEWTVGDGNATVNGGSLNGPGNDLLIAYGSVESDVFTLTRNGTHVTMQAPGATLDISAVVHIDVEGGLFADTITVNDLNGTGVHEVDIDLLQINTPDAVKDTMVVNGTPQADVFKIKATQVQVEHLQNGTGGVIDVPGGVTDVQRDDFLVRAANTDDDLSVNGLQGDDQFVIHSATGPTTLNGNEDADVFKVFVQKFDDYLGPLTVDGQGAQNTIQIDESASPSGDTVRLTSTLVVGDLLPHGVAYRATGGGFGGGVTLVTTPAADTVNLQNTWAGAVTTVDTGDGPDVINVSSDAPVNTGQLAGFQGDLVLDAGPGVNVLRVSDVAAGNGNGHVVVTGQTIQGFLGPTDAVNLAYTATGGSFGLIRLDGSDAATVDELFLITSPNGPLDLRTHGGADHVIVQGLGGASSIDTGDGNDEVRVEVTAASAYDLAVNGGPQTSNPPGDFLRVTDVGGGAVLHDHVQGGGSGKVEAFYLNGFPSHITYQDIENVVPAPDADHSFVQALYHTVDKRDGSAAEVDAGVTALHGGTTRMSLADQFEHSGEARTKLIAGWNKVYFNHLLTSSQLLGAHNYIVNHTEEQTLSWIFQKRVPQPVTLAKKKLVVKAVYQILLGQLPTLKELKQGVQILTNGNVGKFVLTVLKGVKYRTKVVTPYFSTILRRSQPPSLSEVKMVLAPGDNLTTIRVKMEGSQEFYDNGH